jgi:hypothetical protein
MYVRHAYFPSTFYFPMAHRSMVLDRFVAFATSGTRHCETLSPDVATWMYDSMWNSGRSHSYAKHHIPNNSRCMAKSCPAVGNISLGSLVKSRRRRNGKQLRTWRRRLVYGCEHFQRAVSVLCLMSVLVRKMGSWPSLPSHTDSL